MPYETRVVNEVMKAEIGGREVAIIIQREFRPAENTPSQTRVIGPQGQVTETYGEMLQLLEAEYLRQGPSTASPSHDSTATPSPASFDKPGKKAPASAAEVSPSAQGTFPQPVESSSAKVSSECAAGIAESSDGKDPERVAAERAFAERFPRLPSTKTHHSPPDYSYAPPEKWVEFERMRRTAIFRYEHEDHPLHNVPLASLNIEGAETDMWMVRQAEWIKWVYPERYEAALDPEKYRTFFERYPEERHSEDSMALAAAGAEAAEAPRCQFTKSDGTICGSPAMKNKRLCYFHDQTADSRKRKGSAQSSPRRFHLPVLEDDRAIQMAVTNVCRSLVDEALDSKRATTLLYGLQVASSALRRRLARTEAAGS